jgi:hypothetical protein
MAGMISQAQQSPQEAPQPQQNMAQNEPNAAQNAPTNPEEAYNIASGQMLNFLYEDAGKEALTTMIQSASDPGKGMARLMARLLVTVEQSARLAGQKLPPEVIFTAGMELAAAMSEMAQSEGLLDKTGEKEATENAFFEAISLFANEAGEEALTEGDRQSYVAMIDQIEEMAAGQQGQAPQEAQQPQEPQPQQPPQEAMA